MRLGGTQHVQYGTTSIEYELVFARRKTLAIHVYPDASVVVNAPLNADPARVEAFVIKRGGWILKQQRTFNDAPLKKMLPRRYVSGEEYRYLGKQYRLKVIEDQVERVTLDGSFLVVAAHNLNDTAGIGQLVEAWYLREARRTFADRLTACFPRVEPLGIALPPLYVRAMKARWGSCSPQGKLTLNPKLIQMPIDLIDYVILHELCHLKEMNHSPHFYALLDRVIPDWRDRRKKLNRVETL